MAVVSDDVAAVFLGRPQPPYLDALRELMPLLALALRAEQEARFARAGAEDARATLRRAEALATGLDAARAEHARLNAQLQDEHRRKDDFLAMLAHELRNPLSPLVTSIELIRRAGGVASERQLDIMSRQLRHLTRLVEDLLDVSRVSRGRIDLRRQRVGLAEVLGHAVDASRPLFESRGHRLVVDEPPPGIAVHGDPVRLAQIFFNLLHNAAKYTDPGGEIHIRTCMAAERVVVTVQDNGIGIEPSVLPHVFDLFVQAPTSLARSQGGLGIGLRLVKALVELHGGNVTASSAGLGHGSAFTVSIPVVEGATETAGAAPRQVRGASPWAARVLVVDD
ncbi:MAG: HAMP domain-containing histidine kinase, partial [Myxococcales bacterium]|nr:HAMP domain-containing histidine kinase [Myxococcales bacterium]